MGEEAVLQLSHRDYLEADRDYEKSASIVRLLYIKDSDPGICRKKKGKGYSYIFESRPIKVKSEIERIRKLAIPPAWENVWICKEANGHIQATGIDMRRRKQYRYHALWNVFRNETKFH